MSFIALLYVVAGFCLAGFYVPQILRLIRDRTGLAAYSFAKAQAQLACRAAMMPLVFVTVDSWVILGMQSLDLALRATEVAAAAWSKRQQRRVLPGLAPLVDG